MVEARLMEVELEVERKKGGGKDSSWSIWYCWWQMDAKGGDAMGY